MKFADALKAGLNDNMDLENENEILMKFIQKQMGNADLYKPALKKILIILE